MKLITLTFRTEKGEAAYRKVEAEGKKASFMEKQIVKKVCRDRVVSLKPLTVEIKVKIPRLAVQLDLEAQVEASLSKFGAKKDIDYVMVVE